MKVASRILLSLVGIVFAVNLIGCSGGGHPKQFLDALEQTQSYYQASAGAEYPGMVRAFQTRGGNASAVLGRLGDMMQKDYNPQTLGSIEALDRASEHFSKLSKRLGFPEDLKKDFEEYSAIIRGNRRFFTTTEPLSELERWFNDYPEAEVLYQRIVEGVSKL